jgi:NADH-quinone oxidoreductase subunit G
MSDTKFLTLDGRRVPIDGERNLLELIRKAGIDLPTFCYHSDLSVYGACRLCIVEVEGRGIQGACSTPPEPNMVVHTNTDEIRDIRKIAVELLLANHDMKCPTCPKSTSCQLQALARKLGITEVRFKPVHKAKPVDFSSPSIVRDPNRCVLCGDCTRVCSEIQGIGAIDFAFRGSDAQVLPSFGKDLATVECVNCGQCAAVCPTGALTPKSEVEGVWKALGDKQKKVVVQIAPAVRVALGEAFGMAPGSFTAGQAVAALKAMGFAAVYDTSFSADLTVIEEATEFLNRVEKGEKLPQFTSCCPAWVKYAEQYYPELLPNLSSCRSPQQMLGSLAKATLPAKLGVEAKDLIVVSVMPCTAKKFEAQRPEFAKDGAREVDFVLTTQELARMIEESGLRFKELAPESFDLPMGFKTGAGVIFGASGGVTEAALRFAAEKLTGQPGPAEIPLVRGEGGLRTAEIVVAGKTLRLAVVHGLKNAGELAKKVKAGEVHYDLIEVMACPGGCIGGAGQPVAKDRLDARRKRTAALFNADKALELHKSQENPFVTEAYRTTLGEVGGHKAHELLHTHYHSRRRLQTDLDLGNGKAEQRIPVKVCVGTSCFLKGSQTLLKSLLEDVEKQGLGDMVDIKASFCFEKCDRGPSVEVGGEALEHCTFERARDLIQAQLKARGFQGKGAAVPVDVKKDERAA